MAGAAVKRREERADPGEHVPAPGTGSVDVEVDYKYDAWGDRLEYKVIQSGTTTLTRRFAYDGWDGRVAMPADLKPPKVLALASSFIGTPAGPIALPLTYLYRLGRAIIPLA